MHLIHTIVSFKMDMHALFLSVYSLQECCTRLIRSMVRKEDICKLEIPEGLRKELSRDPDLLRDIQILDAKRAINGSNWPISIKQEAELIYDVMLKWKYAEAHTFTLNMWKNLSLLSLLFCVILCNDRASALLLYFLDQSDSRMVTYCCTWKQQIWVKVI